MRGIVRINNPFLNYFSLILRDVSGYIPKIRDIFITKQTFRYRDVSNLFCHSSNLTRINQKFTGIYKSLQKE